MRMYLPILLLLLCSTFTSLKASGNSHSNLDDEIRQLIKQTLTSLTLLNNCSNVAIDFSNTGPLNMGTGDIVNGSNPTNSFSFDIWDETNNSCASAGGVDDVTITFGIVGAFDAYGGSIIDANAGVTHDVIQDGTGLKGANPLGTSGATETSTGDVRGYTISVTFAAHVIITAGDLTVNTTSINTRGTAFESASILFLDASGMPLGTASYTGYYGANGPAVVPGCPGISPAPTANPWLLSASGAFAAHSIGTVNTAVADGCNPATGANGSDDNADVAATSTGIAAATRISGFTFTAYLEDVAAAAADGVNSTTSTSFTSTLNSIDLTTVCFESAMPVELNDFAATAMPDHSVYLNWETTSETNNDHFMIQHSTNGIRFIDIAKINGHGTTLIPQQYNYLHQAASEGENYYRLRQVDIDGRFSFGPVRVVNISSVKTLKLFPVPARESIEISLGIPASAQAEIEIFNLSGQLVKRLTIEESISKIQIGLAELPPAAYVLRYTDVKHYEIKEFVKVY